MKSSMCNENFLMYQSSGFILSVSYLIWNVNVCTNTLFEEATFYSLSLFGIKYSMDKFLYRLVKLKVCSDMRYLIFSYQELTLKLVSWALIWHCYKQSKNNGFIFNFVLIYCTLLHCSTAYLFQASKTFRQKKAEIIREQKTYLN